MKKLTISLFFIFITLWVTPVISATDSEVNERQVKAAFIYKFATYVEWPADAPLRDNSPVIVGVIGAEEVASELRYLRESRSATDRDVRVKILKPGDPLTGIQMLFVGKEEVANLKSILDPVQAKPILTITESANGLNTGSIINFLLVDDHVRFEVSVKEAERSGLKISARLLAVAQKTESRRSL